MSNAVFDALGNSVNESEIEKNELKGNDVEEERWGQLPTLLIWMIKDLLSFGDNARLASICRNWNHASLSYPSKPQQKYVVPWLRHKRQSSTEWVFTNVSTKETFVLDVPEFCCETHQFLFSRRGWLLFRKFIWEQFPWKYTSIILLNLHTNAKIIMTYPGEQVGELMASFSSVDDGTPKFVVFDVVNNTCRTFYIANVDEDKWTSHSYENGKKMERTVSLVVQGNKVYCLDMLGGLFIYDIGRCVWKEIVGNAEYNINSLRDNFRWWMMESDEEDILKIDRGSDLETFSFFRFSESKSDWEELNHNDAKDRSWFLLHRHNYHCIPDHFTVKVAGGGKKVYHSAGIRSEWNSTLFKMEVKSVVSIHDLISGSKQPYVVVGNVLRWVDLGWMDKVPPSCKQYVPPPN